MRKTGITMVIGIVLLGIILVLILLRGNEDDWIKDSRGVLVKHGNPSKTPVIVIEQQNLLNKAKVLYQQSKDSHQDLSLGPCLGKISDDWVVDIVHAPRIETDNKPENQCEEFRSGEVEHFIELDLEGNIITVY